MFDLVRLRGLLVAGFFVAASLLLFHQGLALSWPPDRVAPYQSTVTPGAPEDVGRKIATDMAQNRGALRPPGGRLGVVIGASTGYYAASNLPALQQESGLPAAWFGYYETGGSASDLNRLAILLRRFGVAPDYLVLCLNPCMMADSDRGAEAGYFPNVMNFNRHARDFLLRSKIEVLGRFGQDQAEVVFIPDLNPRREFGRVTWGHYDVSQIYEKIFADFRKLGFFDPASYPIGGVNYRALVDLVRRERRLGTKVIAVLLPETSNYRAMYPPEAKRSLIAALESCTGDERPLILDFSRYFHDSLFMDFHHVAWNNVGPMLFCGELGRRIRAAESGGPTTQEVLSPWSTP